MFRKAHHSANDESKLARDPTLSVIFELLFVSVSAITQCRRM
jgi:hypothetical protein